MIAEEGMFDTLTLTETVTPSKRHLVLERSLFDCSMESIEEEDELCTTDEEKTTATTTNVTTTINSTSGTQN